MAAVVPELQKPGIHRCGLRLEICDGLLNVPRGLATVPASDVAQHHNRYSNPTHTVLKPVALERGTQRGDGGRSRVAHWGPTQWCSWGSSGVIDLGRLQAPPLGWVRRVPRTLGGTGPVAAAAEPHYDIRLERWLQPA